MRRRSSPRWGLPRRWRKECNQASASHRPLRQVRGVVLPFAVLGVSLPNIPARQENEAMKATSRLGIGILAWLMGGVVWGQEPPAQPKVEEPPSETIAAWTKA